MGAVSPETRVKWAFLTLLTPLTTKIKINTKRGAIYRRINLGRPGCQARHFHCDFMWLAPDGV
jgi:hypothetical protein